jgi:hypothetical protein
MVVSFTPGSVQAPETRVHAYAEELRDTGRYEWVRWVTMAFWDEEGDGPLKLP